MNYWPSADDYRIRYMKHFTRAIILRVPSASILSSTFNPLITDNFEVKSTAVTFYKGKVR